MILVLAGGGNEVKEFSATLAKERIEHLCVFSSFAEAGSFGSGNAIVGKLSRTSIEELLKSEKISGVVDISAGGDIDQSANAMMVCKEIGIPYVKYLRLPAKKEDYPKAIFCRYYKEVADAINNCTGTALLYTAPETAKVLSKMVIDANRLYTPILRGNSFDVELALEFGIPIVNVIEVDGVDGNDAVRDAIKRVGAGILVCDGAVSLPDKIKTAEELGISMFVTHKMGVEYSKIALSYEELLSVILCW